MQENKQGIELHSKHLARSAWPLHLLQHSSAAVAVDAAGNVASSASCAEARLTSCTYSAVSSQPADRVSLAPSIHCVHLSLLVHCCAFYERTELPITARSCT
jgi:ubiquitin C-terminal hydrolase